MSHPPAPPDDFEVLLIDDETEYAATLVTNLLAGVAPGLDKGLAYPIVIELLMDDAAEQRLDEYIADLRQTISSATPSKEVH